MIIKIRVKLASGSNGQYYAAKVFKNNHALTSNIKALVNEIKIMQKLNHPNLVNLIEYNESMPYLKKNGNKESRVVIILELAQGGELFEYVAQSGKFSEETSRFYFKQLLGALQYLHEKGIAHRDLKPENLLFDSKFNLKVADFGFATLLEKYNDGKLKTVLGTEGYMAPEIHAKSPYDGKSVDLFAAAIVLFIMFAGSPPFSKATTNDPYYKLITSNKNDIFWKFHAKHKGNPDFFSDSFKNLLNSMFQVNPALRPTMEQILQHPWVNGKTSTLQEIQAEFGRRKLIVDAEVEKERLKKQASKQKNVKGDIYTGVGKFRSVVDMQKDFSIIQQQFGLNDTRDLKLYDQNGCQQNDFFTAIDQDYILFQLLSKSNEFCNQVVKVSADKYKFTVRCVDEDNDILEIDIEFRKFDDDLINIDFVKREGQSLKYHEKVNQIKNFIQQLGNEQNDN